MTKIRPSLSIPAVLVLLFSVSCATYRPPICNDVSGQSIHCPDESTIFDPEIEALYHHRRWATAHDPDFDTIEIGANATVPIQQARTKIIGPFGDDMLRSLAVKIWMIENARHTIDIVYYIYKLDRVGFALVGALCNAAKRGVDIRFLVDAIGSFQISHAYLRALESCAENGTKILEASGERSRFDARIQAGVINAVSSRKSRINRRSHDKLLVIDGHFPEHGMVLTGGRNISLDYYGIQDDGSPDPHAFQDVEILLRPAEKQEGEYSVSAVGELYFSLLFGHEGNRPVRAVRNPDGGVNTVNTAEYERILRRADQDLQFIKNLPGFQAVWSEMPRYMQSGYRNSRVRLAHELSNLTNKGALSNVEENFRKNPNAINYLLYEIAEKSTQELGDIKIVSPYLFLPLFKDRQGGVIFDGASEILQWLDDHPKSTLEIITNSVMTSDNFLAQSIIDLDMAPRLLFPEDLREQWLNLKAHQEADADLVLSDEWQRLVNHPRLAIWQTGKIDAVEFGGSTYYGKLHAKFILANNFGFVGTSNFDYRSRLLNNEFGYFFQDRELHADLLDIFERFKQKSHYWGSKDWLRMRQLVIEGKGIKGRTTRWQRFTYRFMKFWNLKWLI